MNIKQAIEQKVEKLSDATVSTKKWLLDNGFKKTEGMSIYMLDTPLGMRFRVILGGPKMGLTVYRKENDSPRVIYNFAIYDISSLKSTLLHHIKTAKYIDLEGE